MTIFQTALLHSLREIGSHVMHLLRKKNVAFIGSKHTFNPIAFPETDGTALLSGEADSARIVI